MMMRDIVRVCLTHPQPHMPGLGLGGAPHARARARWSLIERRGDNGRGGEGEGKGGRGGKGEGGEGREGEGGEGRSGEALPT